MNVVASPSDLTVRGAIVALGAFDGVHLGHRALLRTMRAVADDTGRPTAIVTFFPPPKVHFLGTSYLSTVEEKVRLFQPYAPDEVVVVPFDDRFAATPADTFVGALRACEPYALVVGPDFKFGRQRAGSIDDLGRVTPRIDVVPWVEDAHGPIKSSRIRELLAVGRVEQATHLLGRPYPVIGTVVEGDRRGRTIGYPTANLHVDARKMVPEGVYAAWVDGPMGTVPAMVNAGPRPTFDTPAPRVEAHCFDVDFDLYGASLTVSFVRKVRDAVRFASVDALVARLHEDERQARAILHALAAI